MFNEAPPAAVYVQAPNDTNVGGNAIVTEDKSLKLKPDRTTSTQTLQTGNFRRNRSVSTH